MKSALPKYLNEQPGVFLNVKQRQQQKRFLRENVFV